MRRREGGWMDGREYGWMIGQKNGALGEDVEKPGEERNAGSTDGQL